MLGWMLRRGENAPDAVGGGDTTQLDQPDTPAPVFAARAFKSALFGTPTRGDASLVSRNRHQVNSESEANGNSSETPSKPQGILLTPGTGTTRRKRVSFNRDALATTKTISPNSDTAGNKRTRLSIALDKASRKISDEKAKKKTDSEEEWEEEDSDDDFCTQDITLDLNEPHSQSGKYWKEEFQKYQQEAKAEMEKLLKYKHLAKSYAREKDAEAIHLTEMLKEEQERVIAMEKKIAESANQMASKQKDTSANESSELLTTLTKQTALAAQYRHRVQELEAQLEDLLREREEDTEPKDRKRRSILTSPNTQRTLMETQRELRRARSQLKELDALRKQVSSLKSQLRRAGHKDGPTGDGFDETSADAASAKELKLQLKLIKEESSKKDAEIQQLKTDFESFRKESEAHDADSKAVLERAHTKISTLKNEVKALKANTSAEKARPKSWHQRSEVDALIKEDTSANAHPKTSALMSGARRSIDLAEIAQPSILETADLKSRTLRQKYREDATVAKNQVGHAASRNTVDALADRPNLEKPRWQPFVPRSPRNRAYLDDDALKRIENGGSTAPTPRGKAGLVPDLPALAKSISRSRQSAYIDETEDIEVDLLQDRFARLGGPDSGGLGKAKKPALSSNTKGSIPPERRAAALARIEKRMADRKALRRDGADKENVRP